MAKRACMKHIIKASCPAFLTLALLITGTVLSTKQVAARPMTAQDLATLNRLGAPAVSPNEKWLAFQVTATDPKSYKRTTGLYLLDIYTPNARPIRIADNAEHDEHSPAFSSDGKSLYYISDASGSEQLWRVNILAGGQEGEPVQASDLKADIAGYKLSPSGSRVALWGDIALKCETFGCD